MSDLCQNTVVPDVHCQQWDCSQGLAEEQFSGNFPASSFYSLSLIYKGSNFSFLKIATASASLQSATSRLHCQIMGDYQICH